ncbi:MAG: TRAP transporter small permease [Ichthyobacteriaceae bacterium]|nr:TRAP transporter small permease [Ichthyobacteriaceae bacterium]
MGGIVLSIVWQVISRYVFNSPSEYTDELSRYLLIWVGVLGAAYVTGTRGHISLDFFIKKYFTKQLGALDVFSNLLIIAFAFVVLIIGGGRLVFITLSLGQISAALQVPLGYVYSVLPIGGAIIVFYSIYHIYSPKKDLE